MSYFCRNPREDISIRLSRHMKKNTTNWGELSLSLPLFTSAQYWGRPKSLAYATSPIQSHLHTLWQSLVQHHSFFLLFSSNNNNGTPQFNLILLQRWSWQWLHMRRRRWLEIFWRRHQQEELVWQRNHMIDVGLWRFITHHTASQQCKRWWSSS